MTEEEEIIENTVVYSLLKYVSYVLLIITGLIITKALGPEMFGIFSAMMLVLNYSRYSFMGFYSACFKKLSFFKGRNQIAELQDIRDSTFGPSFILSVILAAGVFIASFILNLDSQMTFALRITPLLIILQQGYYFYTIYLRTDKNFTFFGIVDLVFNSSRLVLLLIFIKHLGVVLALIFMVISYIIALSIGMYCKPYTFKLKFRFKKAKRMFLFGVPNTLFGAMGTIFTSIDKIMVLRYFNNIFLGFYSFAILVLEMITFIPANIAIIILPRQLERFGAYTDGDKVKNIFYLPMIVISYLLPIIIGGAFFFSMPVVKFIFPKYLEALPPLYVLIFGAFFLSNLYMLETHVVSVNKETKIMPLKILFILLSIGLNYYAISNGLGIFGVALATVIIYATYFVFLLSYVLKGFYPKFKNYIKNIAIIIVPFVYTTTCLFLIDTFFNAAEGIMMNFIIAVGKYGVFLVLNIPLWYYVNKRTKIITTAITLALSQIRKL